MDPSAHPSSVPSYVPSVNPSIYPSEQNLRALQELRQTKLEKVKAMDNIVASG